MGDEVIDAASVSDVDELVERIPEIQTLRGRVRDEVARVFVEDVPEHFWLARASESHHPPDERGLGGTWLHTRRVFTAYTILENTYRSMSMIDSFEANCARAAVLLHDAFKYGDGATAEETSVDVDDVGGHDYAEGVLDDVPEYTLPEHDVLMADHVSTETDLPAEVAICVECHGGSNEWYGHEGPEPFDEKTMLVHLADVMASNSNHRLPVYGGTGLLEKAVGDVPTIDDEDWLENLDDF